MATNNRRVAAYLPPHVDEKFQEFKQKTGIQGDSEAFIKIVMEYLGVDHPVSQEVSFTQYSDLVKRLKTLESIDLVTQQHLSELKMEVAKEIALAIANSESNSELKSEPPEKSQDHSGQMSLMPPKEVELSNQPSASHGDIPDGLLKGLSARQLSKRLHVGRNQPPLWYQQGVLAEETQRLDPDNIAWMFDETDTKHGKYHPVQSDLPY